MLVLVGVEGHLLYLISLIFQQNLSCDFCILWHVLACAFASNCRSLRCSLPQLLHVFLRVWGSIGVLGTEEFVLEIKFFRTVVPLHSCLTRVSSACHQQQAARNEAPQSFFHGCPGRRPTTATPSCCISARGKLQCSWMRGSVWAHGEVQHAGTSGHKQAALGVKRKRCENRTRRAAL